VRFRLIKKSTGWVLLVYGLVIIGLGYLGYHQSQSMASLKAGMGSGILLIISSFFVFFKYRAGNYMGLIITFLLTAIFCYRYAVSQGSLPAVLAVMSGGMLIYLLVQVGKWKK
jgi:uncharacterized membrane protein (UPF0136 family)